MQIPNLIYFFLLLISFCSASSRAFNETTIAAKADVGVILDLDTPLGKILKTCVSMSIEDFYSKHENYATKIVPHFRDSRTDVVAATSSAIDLLKNTQVMAIFGPQRSAQADFVVDIGNEINVPIISPATSPAISAEESPYFIRSAWRCSSQAKAIAATVKAFNWREVTFIYQKSKFGSGLLKSLFDGLIRVSHQTVLCSCTKDDQILTELNKLKTMQNRVFVVHMEANLASRFFRKAKEAGMMGTGYAWIIVDSLTSLYSMDPEAIEAMQGVIGLKAYIPRSNELKSFEKRWRRRFLVDYPDMETTHVNAYGLWAYDSMTALAEAVERVGLTTPRFDKPVEGGNSTDLEAIGTSSVGPSLANLIRNYSSRGLSGNFDMVNGELQASAFEIVNVIGGGEHTVGFWTERYGLSKGLKPSDDDEGGVNSTKKKNLGAIIWPGKATTAPRGWEIPTNGTRLRVGVPMRGGFEEIIKVDRDPETGEIKANGFSIDVFEEVMRRMPYAVQYEYIPFNENGEYDDLVKGIHFQKYDAVVGDITVTADRSEYADFTIPYTESGVVALVPIRNSGRKNTWIFMKPLTTGLWLTILAFFLFIGIVVWVLEHRVNHEFRGPPAQQVGMMFWFSFSTLVFAHREKVINNLTRFVMIVWLFVVLVLTQSYTASLTSMLTVQQLKPTITEINDLIKRGEYIGYQKGSFVSGFLDSMEFDRSKFRSYSTAEYDEALTNGGVAAIIDEVPYIKLFLSKNCHKYTMIGPSYKTSGFGFAFPKGSPLVPDVSREILRLKEGKKMVEISKKWLGDEDEKCQHEGAEISSESLNVDSFKGLFVIAGVSSLSALAIFFFTFVYDHRCILTSTAPIKQKIYELAQVFSREKVDKSTRTGNAEGGRVAPAISILCDHQEIVV